MYLNRFDRPSEIKLFFDKAKMHFFFFILFFKHAKEKINCSIAHTIRTLRSDAHQLFLTPDRIMSASLKADERELHLPSFLQH